ncbi:MAG: hypothetical protein VKL41_18565 [Snowella sp.]|nr:hypothetical protein [Snowella sp.]
MHKHLKIIIRKIIKRVNRYFAHIVSLPAQIAWGLTKSNYIDKRFFLPRYYRAIALHQSQLPLLEWQDQQIVNALESEGIYMTSVESLNLPNSVEFMKVAQKMTELLQENTKHLFQRFPSEQFHEVYATEKQVIDHIDIIAWSLNQRLINIVEAYLKLPVAYDGPACFLSVNNGEEYGARAWHRDREDRRMIKVCVYLNDVDEEGGPVQCLKPRFNDYVCAAIKHRYRSVYQAEMDSLYLPEFGDALVSCVGKIGTVILLDTARFYHRGKAPMDSDRKAIFFSYFSRSPWHPFFCQRFPLPLREVADRLPELSQQQWESIDWRKKLPQAVRWIPKSLI